MVLPTRDLPVGIGSYSLLPREIIFQSKALAYEHPKLGQYQRRYGELSSRLLYWYSLVKLRGYLFADISPRYVSLNFYNQHFIAPFLVHIALLS